MALAMYENELTLELWETILLYKYLYLYQLSREKGGLSEMMLGLVTCMWKNNHQIAKNIEADRTDLHTRQKDKQNSTAKSSYRKTSDSQGSLSVFGAGMCWLLLAFNPLLSSLFPMSSFPPRLLATFIPDTPWIAVSLALCNL